MKVLMACLVCVVVVSASGLVVAQNYGAVDSWSSNSYGSFLRQLGFFPVEDGGRYKSKGLEVAAAYVGHPDGLRMSLGATSNGLGEIMGLELKCPIQGIQLEAGAMSSGGASGLGFKLSGSFVFPVGHDQKATVDMVYGGEVAPPGSPPYGFLSWGRTTQWWDVEAAITFDFEPVGWVIGGIRYDSFMTNLKDPSGLNFGYGARSDTANLTTVLLLPYLGIMANQGSGPNNVSVGLMGFPHVFGSLDYKVTSNAEGPQLIRSDQPIPFQSGYFLEAFVNWTMSAWGGSADLFVKYSVIHVTSVPEIGRESKVPWFPASLYHGETMNFSFDRQYWTAGFRLALGFTSPI